MSKDYSNLSKEELLKLVEKQDKDLKKKYGLVWDSEKEPEKVVLDCENNIPILQKVKEKEIKTDNSDDNILIEGDNYHALTCLNYTHKGKIDVIYIDPPYNTGKADEWKYNDKYVDENDGYRHSKWLNFMEKRLRLARNLLSENGVLFISIDDNEFAQLKLLCDKIFNSNCFVGNIVWERKRKGSHLSDKFTNKTEYILIYSNKGKNIKLFGESVGEEEDQPLVKRTNSIKDLEIPAKLINTKLKDGIYKAGNYGEGSSSVKLLEDITVKNGIFSTNLKLRGPFIWTQNNLDKEVELGAKFFIRTINFSLRALKGSESQGIKALSSFLSRKIGTNEDASDELKEIFSKEKIFDYPKPSSLIKHLIQSKTYFNKNSIILDFFAGSGTTGHAVLELNKQDGGNRKFILCTNNENKICEEVTYPRIHNVIKGYKFKGKDKTTLFEQKLTFNQLKNLDSIVEEMDKTIEENKTKFNEIEKKFKDNTIKITGVKNIDSFKDGLNGNLQYFKTDLIPVERIDNINDKQRQELTKKSGQMIAIKENTFEEIEINEWYQIFENKDKSKKTAIYFREDMSEFENLVDKINETKAVLYVFSYERIDKKIFNYLSKIITVEDIPEPILEIYKEINLTIKDH